MNLDKWKSQIVRGTLEYCILLMLDKKVYYGYEILQELSKYPIITSTESTVYPLLRRLQKENYLQSTWQESTEGLPPRKYYSLTPDGKNYLDAKNKIMNTTFEKYLDTIDKCLKPLPTSERVDIVKEIKGSILEMESENLSTEQILTRLGKPKDLAKAYLGDLLAKENGFSWNRFLTVCAFYSLVGFSGLFVIPVLVIVAPTFILCGVASAVLGIIKLVDYLLHLNIPYVDYIGFQFGNTALSPIPVFILSLITGIILFLLGRGAWKLLITYCKGISKTKNNLSI